MIMFNLETYLYFFVGQLNLKNKHNKNYKTWLQMSIS